MLILILRSMFSSLQAQRALALENLALRHQLDVLQRNRKPPRLKNRDRVLWVALSRIWPNWQTALVIVRPKTVVAWHVRDSSTASRVAILHGDADDLRYRVKFES